METRARGIPDSSAVASAHLIVAHDVRGSQTVQTVRHPADSETPSPQHKRPSPSPWTTCD